jgi:hypothetical protein
MRCIILSLLVMVCGALLAAPHAVEKVADDMLSAGGHGLSMPAEWDTDGEKSAVNAIMER